MNPDIVFWGCGGQRLTDLYNLISRVAEYTAALARLDLPPAAQSLWEEWRSLGTGAGTLSSKTMDQSLPPSPALRVNPHLEEGGGATAATLR